MLDRTEAIVGNENGRRRAPAGRRSPRRPGYVGPLRPPPINGVRGRAADQVVRSCVRRDVRRLEERPARDRVGRVLRGRRSPPIRGDLAGDILVVALPTNQRRIRCLALNEQGDHKGTRPYELSSFPTACRTAGVSSVRFSWAGRGAVFMSSACTATNPLVTHVTADTVHFPVTTRHRSPAPPSAARIGCPMASPG